MNPLKWFLSLLPPESDNSAGWGPFRLPTDAEWMQRAATLHDYDFENSKKSGRKLSEADSDLFYRWTLEAHAEPDPIKRCHKFAQICRYWPLARGFGRYLWDGE